MTAKSTDSDPPSVAIQIAYLTLNFLPPSRFRVRHLLENTPDAVEALDSIREKGKEKLVVTAERAAKAEYEKAAQAGVAVICPDDQRYPALLREVPDKPLTFFMRGSLAGDQAAASIAIVGSRKPTAYGLGVAEKFARDISQRGGCVVSGLAYGIDGAAHQATVKVNGPTIAVLGSGINNLYPRRHASLADEIVGCGGAIISEFAMNARPEPRNFPSRNRIIAGISHGVCVVEAAKRSGSLITARLAGDYGRMVWAVPNRIGEELSEGTTALLRDGATAVASAEDILSDMGPAFQKNLRKLRNHGMVADAVLDAIQLDGSSFDEIAAGCALNRDDVTTRLLELELEGRVTVMAGGIYRRLL